MSARWINRLEQFDSVSITLLIEDGGAVLLRKEINFRKSIYPEISEALLVDIAEQEKAVLLAQPVEGD